MFPYWFFLLFTVFLFFVGRKFSSSLNSYAFFAVWVVFSFWIGFRHEVGGDWFNYLRHFNVRAGLSFYDVVSAGDPAYYGLGYIIYHFGGSIHWLNLICAFILMAGVVSFSIRQPLPWLSLIVSVPYLIIVVGMGYTRQSAALGFLLLALGALSDNKARRFVFFVVLGALFHKSVVLMLPVAALSATKNRYWSIVWVGLASVLAAYFFVYESVDKLWANYVEADYESQGGLVRVLMNSVPAILFLFFRRRLSLPETEVKLWTWMSIFSIACVPMVVLSSTATDRVALYLIPLQLYVFSRLPFVFASRYVGACAVTGIIFYYASVQFVWLNFASHVNAWLPYQMYPFAS